MQPRAITDIPVAASLETNCAKGSQMQPWLTRRESTRRCPSVFEFESWQLALALLHILLKLASWALVHLQVLITPIAHLDNTEQIDYD